MCGSGVCVYLRVCVYTHIYAQNEFFLIFVKTCKREIVSVCLGCDYLHLLIVGALALLHLVKMNFFENICVQGQDGGGL